MTTGPLALTAAAIFLASPLSVAIGATGTSNRDVRVTPDNRPGSYRGLDGTVDSVQRACATRRRQQVEPSVAVDPHSPRVIAVGAMDACIAVRNPIPLPQAQHWVGLYRSADGGRSWKASLLPGYPGDPGPASQGCTQQADATLSFDRGGRLFFGALCPVFNGPSPTDFHIAVSTFSRDGSRFRRTVRVDKPAAGEPEARFASDKPNMAVDQSRGRHAGNVYVAWTQCRRLAAGPCIRYQDDAVIRVARSTNHGRSFSAPVAVKPRGLPAPFFSDLAVGPDGSVYLTFKVDRLSGQGSVEIWLAKSVDGGRSFSTAEPVQAIRPFDSSQFSGKPVGAAPSECGDGSFACSSGFDFPFMRSFSAVTADRTGVHLVWGARTASGQGKIFVRNSRDGMHWKKRARRIDSVARGHQWWPDVASADGAISVVFLDSRRDRSYSTALPPGNTASGASSGPAVDTYVAQSRDGGRTWQEKRLSRVSSRPNFETYLDTRLPWRGDYMYVSAVPGGSFAVWPDSRNVVARDDTRPDSEANGFDVFAPCAWLPNSVNLAGAYTAPAFTDRCLDRGGLDLNIYGSRLPGGKGRQASGH